MGSYLVVLDNGYVQEGDCSFRSTHLGNRVTTISNFAEITTSDIISGNGWQSCEGWRDSLDDGQSEMDGGQ